jgi:hypothetical protein
MIEVSHKFLYFDIFNLNSWARQFFLGVRSKEFFELFEESIITLLHLVEDWIAQCCLIQLHSRRVNLMPKFPQLSKNAKWVT